MAKSARRPPRKPATFRRPSRKGFGQGARPLRAALYARVSASHQQTIPMQVRELREYAARRAWHVAFTVREIKSGAKRSPQRELHHDHVELTAAGGAQEHSVVFRMIRRRAKAADISPEVCCHTFRATRRARIAAHDEALRPHAWHCPS